MKTSFRFDIPRLLKTLRAAAPLAGAALASCGERFLLTIRHPYVPCLPPNDRDSQRP